MGERIESSRRKNKREQEDGKELSPLAWGLSPSSWEGESEMTSGCISRSGFDSDQVVYERL